MASSAPSEVPVLQFYSSEELDVVSIDDEDVEDLPPHYPAYEDLEVVTRAIARLNINWPAEKKDGVEIMGETCPLLCV